MRLLLPLWVYRVPLVRPLLRVTVWRWLERDTTEQGDTYGSPSYGYGKVTGLYPDVLIMTETTESPMVCCGYCSAGMVCRTVKSGLSSKMNATAHPIRTKGGRPHNSGSNATELRNGSKLAHGVTLDAVAVSEIKDRLRSGYAVEIACQYADLPSYLRVQSGDFGHSVMLYGFVEDGDDDLVGFFDPLWPQDARGAWARWLDIKPALWSDGNHNAARSVLSPPTTPPEPPEEPEPTEEPLPCPDPYLEALLYPSRDRAWRAETGTDANPRHPGRWTRMLAWSAFARWAPEPPEDTWNHAAWDTLQWGPLPDEPEAWDAAHWS
jgi:hypothetical protein